MRSTVLILILGFLLIFGCVEETETPEIEVPVVETPETESQESYVDFSDGNFSMDYPSSWTDFEKEEDEILRTGYGNCVAIVKKQTLAPNYLKAVITEHAEQVEWKGDESEFDFSLEDGTVVHSKNKVVFCECGSYWISVSCLKSSFDNETADRIIDSAECSYELPPIYTGKGKPGMIILATEETMLDTYCPNVKRVRETGAPIIHGYIAWGATEKSEDDYDWVGMDYKMEISSLHGMERSIVIDIIRTNDIGDIPSDVEFTSFDDPELKERFADFAVEVLDRYGDNISYIEIGNEVDIYLANHRDEIDEFKELYGYTYDRIKDKHPDVKIGTVFAYHAAKKANATDIIEEISDVGDFNAFTLYIYNENFAFNTDMDEVPEYFDEMDEISEKPFAVVETGWSTSALLESSEEKQAEYVDEVFSILEEKKDRIEFLTWFGTNDIPDETCGLIAESFITEDIEHVKGTEYMKYFEAFICTEGLRTIENEPKPGWNEWIKKTKEYTGIE